MIAFGGMIKIFKPDKFFPAKNNIPCTVLDDLYFLSVVLATFSMKNLSQHIKNVTCRVNISNGTK